MDAQALGIRGDLLDHWPWLRAVWDNEAEAQKVDINKTAHCSRRLSLVPDIAVFQGRMLL